MQIFNLNAKNFSCSVGRKPCREQNNLWPLITVQLPRQELVQGRKVQLTRTRGVVQHHHDANGFLQGVMGRAEGQRFVHQGMLGNHLLYFEWRYRLSTSIDYFL